MRSLCGAKDLNDSLPWKVRQNKNGTCNTVDKTDGCTFVDRKQVTKFLTRRPRASTNPKDATTVGAPFCADRKAVAKGDLLAETQRLLDTLKPPPPTSKIAPPGSTTLVNFPNILAAGPQQPITRNAFAAGIPVTLTARPTAWRWYADGQLVTTAPGPGVPFDDVHLPQNDPGYYLTHTFTTHGPHTYEIRATWAATAVITANNAPIPVTGTITRSAPIQHINALNAHSELIAPTDGTP